MSLQWFYRERVSKDSNAELLREAANWRRAKEARRDAARFPRLPRLFSWFGELASALQLRSGRWAGKSKSLASQRQSYPDNPDPFKDCVAC
jgi:hypothetical protein